MSNRHFVLGIDGGGTRTRAALVGVDGVVMGIGESAGCNYHTVGTALATARIREATLIAFSQAREAPRPLTASFVGAAGIKSATDVIALHGALATSELFQPERLGVANDSESAHAAALAGRPGVVLICGTGSVALARGASGRGHLCGGWGWLIDDVASACWFGNQALQAVARAADGRGRPTLLTGAVMKFLAISEPYELLQRIYVHRCGPAEIGALAPLVMSTAQEGDPVATEILQTGATEAARLVGGAAVGADLGPSFDVALAGGVARSGVPFQPLLEAAIRRLLPRVNLVESSLPPVMGSAIRALSMAGVAHTPRSLDRLKESLSAVSCNV